MGETRIQDHTYCCGCYDRSLITTTKEYYICGNCYTYNKIYEREDLEESDNYYDFYQSMSAEDKSEWTEDIEIIDDNPITEQLKNMLK